MSSSSSTAAKRGRGGQQTTITAAFAASQGGVNSKTVNNLFPALASFSKCNNYFEYLRSYGKCVSPETGVGMHSRSCFQQTTQGKQMRQQPAHSTKHAKLTRTERDWGYWAGGGGGEEDRTKKNPKV